MRLNENENIHKAIDAIAAVAAGKPYHCACSMHILVTYTDSQ